MTRTELLTELREAVDDTAAPYMWSETRLRGFLSEGQDKFCEDTGLFVSLTPLILEEGKRDYDIPSRTIEVLEVFNGARPLRKWQTGQIPGLEPGAGMPSAWQADAATGLLRFDRTPTAAQAGAELTLRRWHYSDTPLSSSVDGVAAAPQLPERLQRACIEWAAYKLLRFHDAEVEGSPEALEHLQAYRDYVSEGKKWQRRHSSFEMSVGATPAYMVSP